MNNYDKINVPLYKDGSEKHYLCSMCGQYTTLSDSVSHQGYNMICSLCLYKISRIFRKSVGELILLIQDEGESRKKEENNE